MKAFNTADAAAKVAEANSKKIAGDANKKPAEKQAAAKAATDKRNLANTAKTKLTQEQAKEKTTQTAATTAKAALTKAQATEAAAVKTDADKVKALTDAKAADTKAKADVTATAKAIVDTKKVADAAKVESGQGQGRRGSCRQGWSQAAQGDEGAQRQESILALTRVPNHRHTDSLRQQATAPCAIGTPTPEQASPQYVARRAGVRHRHQPGCNQVCLRKREQHRENLERLLMANKSPNCVASETSSLT